MKVRFGLFHCLLALLTQVFLYKEIVRGERLYVKCIYDKINTKSNYDYRKWLLLWEILIIFFIPVRTKAKLHRITSTKDKFCTHFDDFEQRSTSIGYRQRKQTL
jgi:hypothetical protein